MVPTSWDEVTLKQLTEIDRLQEEGKVDAVSVLSVLANRDVDEVSALPLQFVELMIGKLDFIKSAPEVEPSDRIEIDGEVYQVNVKERLTFGEFVATQMALDGDKHCYAQLLAILCRKVGEKYDSAFENEVLPGRIELFNNAPCTKALAVTAFFLELWEMSNLPSQVSLLKQAALSLTAENISSLGKGGVGSGCFTRWRAKRDLRRLMKWVENRF